MDKRTRVATEQAREFYKKVAKPRWRERYIVKTVHPGNSPVIYTVWDTETKAPFKYCFFTRAGAEEACAYFNNKHRKNRND